MYDYSNIVYPIPFNELYQNKSKRYLFFGDFIPGLNHEVITGELPAFTVETSDVLMMTGASENHVFSSFNCLYSMVLADPYASYAYLDAGITRQSRNKLFSHFDTILDIQRKMNSTGHLSYRVLNWKHFPDWMSLIKNKRQSGGYSWREISYIDVFYEWKAIFYWLDAGDIINEGISREVTMARHYGLYSPRSSNDIKRWVHNDTQHFMVKHGLLHDYIPGNGNMVCGGILIMNWLNSTIRNSFVPSFLMCAYTKKCIAPHPSNLGNHRFDQAVVSLLIANYRIPYSGSTAYDYSPIKHADNNGDEKKSLLVLNNLFLKIQHTYSIVITNKLYKTSNISFTQMIYPEVSRPIDRNWPDSVVVT